MTEPANPTGNPATETGYNAINDLNPPSIRKSFDLDSGLTFKAMVAAAADRFKPNSLANVGNFKAIVLRVETKDEKQTPGGWFSSFFGGDDGPEPRSLIEIKARVPEIHSMLPVPSQLGSADGAHQGIIDMYPTFVAQTTAVEEPKPGDLVWVDWGNRQNWTDPYYINPVLETKPGTGGQGGPGGAGAFGGCSGGSYSATAPPGDSMGGQNMSMPTHTGLPQLAKEPPPPQTRPWLLAIGGEVTMGIGNDKTSYIDMLGGRKIAVQWAKTYKMKEQIDNVMASPEDPKVIILSMATSGDIGRSASEGESACNEDWATTTIAYLEDHYNTIKFYGVQVLGIPWFPTLNVWNKKHTFEGNPYYHCEGEPDDGTPSTQRTPDRILQGVKKVNEWIAQNADITVDITDMLEGDSISESFASKATGDLVYEPGELLNKAGQIYLANKIAAVLPAHGSATLEAGYTPTQLGEGELPPSLQNGSYIIFGDSQSRGKLGRSVEKRIREYGLTPATDWERMQSTRVGAQIREFAPMGSPHISPRVMPSGVYVKEGKGRSGPLTIQPALQKGAKNIIFIGGGNSAFRPKAKVKGAMKDIIDNIVNTQGDGSAKITIIGPPKAFKEGYKNDERLRVNVAYEELAAIYPNVSVFNGFSVFSDQTKADTGDGVHMSTNGAQKLVDRIFPPGGGPGKYSKESAKHRVSGPFAGAGSQLPGTTSARSGGGAACVGTGGTPQSGLGAAPIPSSGAKYYTEAERLQVCHNVNACFQKHGIAPFEVAALLSFMKVESGFRRPKRKLVRFEPHVWKKNGGKANQAGGVPYIPGSVDCGEGKAKTPGVPKPDCERTTKVDFHPSHTNRAAFDRAARINMELAVRSTSWGSFQVMGFNFKKIVREQFGGNWGAFVTAYDTNADSLNVEILCDFIMIVQPILQTHLRNKDWRNVAIKYNGSPLYQKKLEKFYNEYKEAGHA